MITNVYIDGFNLFYGALKGTPYKWLDLDELCRRLLPKDDIHRIRYFTARVVARPHDPRQPDRQQAYLRALATLPKVTVHEGEFYVTYPRMRLHRPQAPPGQSEEHDARRHVLQATQKINFAAVPVPEYRRGT